MKKYARKQTNKNKQINKKKQTHKKKPALNKQTHILAQILAGGTLVLLAFFATLIYLSDQKGPTEEVEENYMMGTPSKEVFIEQLVEKAQSVQIEYGVLPSISISQAILESNWGESTLAKENQNYYGIKGMNPETSSLYQTKEFVKESEEWIQIEAPFRVYPTWEESMEDHAKLLAHGTGWNTNLYQDVINAPTYKEAAHALQKAGYATDPTYPEKLIRLIEQYELFRYDQ